MYINHSSSSVSHSVVSDSTIPWTVACQAPLSTGFSRQENWSGLPFPSTEDLPDPGIEPRSPALAGRFWEDPILTGSSVQLLSLSDSLRPHGLQHTRPPCPSPAPGFYLNSCPLSQWRHPTIWSSIVPFSSCLQSFPASGSFQMSQFFASGGQSIGVSASASVLPMNSQDWFSLGLAGWISLQSKGLSRVFSPALQFRSISSLVVSSLYSPALTSIRDYWKNHSFD